MSDGPSGHGTHAMVLDTIKNGNFIFKNTYVKDKQVTIPLEEGPLEFYYLHLELKEEAIEELKKNMEKELNENMEKELKKNMRRTKKWYNCFFCS